MRFIGMSMFVGVSISQYRSKKPGNRTQCFRDEKHICQRGAPKRKIILWHFSHSDWGTWGTRGRWGQNDRWIDIDLKFRGGKPLSKAHTTLKNPAFHYRWFETSLLATSITPYHCRRTERVIANQQVRLPELVSNRDGKHGNFCNIQRLFPITNHNLPTNYYARLFGTTTNAVFRLSIRKGAVNYFK